MGVFVGLFLVAKGIIEAIRIKWNKHNLVTFQVKNRFKLTKFDGSVYYEDGDVFCLTKKVKKSLKCDSQNRVKSCNSNVMYIQFFDSPIKSLPHKSEIWKGEERFNDLDMTQFM